GVASKVVAVDLDQENCDRLNALGFDFRCIDATSEAYLGERFDCIFAGDVIEHVNDPVAFLVFAKRHLKESGSLLLTTPNPFARRYRASRSKGGYLYVMANLDRKTAQTPLGWSRHSSGRARTRPRGRVSIRGSSRAHRYVRPCRGRVLPASRG
ncbi:MAG: methyltransferase domain-containing protein, partial [Betaproteobacteria bacterium]|nr:methyltransferase domain-containing protein [Betaproteobacteria bacterium]